MDAFAIWSQFIDAATSNLSRSRFPDDISPIVEGIEEDAKLALVREHRADFVQGVLLGRSAPVAKG